MFSPVGDHINDPNQSLAANTGVQSTCFAPILKSSPPSPPNPKPRLIIFCTHPLFFFSFLEHNRPQAQCTSDVHPVSGRWRCYGRQLAPAAGHAIGDRRSRCKQKQQPFLVHAPLSRSDVAEV
jgi:hypothetical protein